MRVAVLWGLVAGLLACALPSAAAAMPMPMPGGGAVPYAAPSVSRVLCATRCGGTAAARPGSLLRVRGRSLARVTKVVFLGGPGGRDDRAAATRRAHARVVEVRVPDGAVTGPLRLIDGGGMASDPTAQPVMVLQAAATSGGVSTDLAPASVPAAGAYVFPIRGAFRFDTGAGRFGARRAGHTHEGQDVFARCGTPLVAARGGVVKAATFESAAGNYVVIAADDGRDMAYMHLRDPALVSEGDTVVTGQPIGFVGDTGDAQGCHLHFELWTAPGWYSGGAPVDPLPTLREWAAAKRRSRG